MFAAGVPLVPAGKAVPPVATTYTVPADQDGVTVTVTPSDPATVRWAAASPAVVKVTASGGAARFSLRGNAAPDSSGVVTVADGDTASVSTKAEATPLVLRIATDSSVSVTVAGFRDADTPVSSPYPVVTLPNSGGASKLSDLTDLSKAGAAPGKVVSVASTSGGNVTGWSLADPVSGGSGAVSSVAGKVGDVTLTKSDVGLNNVNNTADANKPISSATQAALDGKAAASHTQASSTITDFTEAVQDAVGAMLGAGSNVVVNYDDTAGTLTISATGTGGSGLDAEAVRDAIGVALVGVGNVAVVVNDAADTITITTTATQNATDAALRDRDTHTDGTTYKGFTAAEKTKLGGLAAVASSGSYGDLTVPMTRNPLTGWFAFDAWTPNKTGTVDITAKLQAAVNAVIAAGGGTLYVGPGRYRINGTVYINKSDEITPFRLLGEFVDVADIFPTGGTVFYKPTAGDMFRHNLNTDLTPYVNWYHYSSSSTFENFACEGTASAETYGIRAYRSRLVVRGVAAIRLDGLMMQDRQGPSGYTDVWNNYCDQSLYEDIRFVYAKTCAMSLTGCDSVVFNRISYQYPEAGAVYGIRLYYGCAVTMTGILYSDGVHNSTDTLQSFIEATGVSGFSLNGIHIEEPDHQAFFNFSNTFGAAFAGLHVRFRSRTIFKFADVRGVTIDGWNSWATLDSGFYDIDAPSGCADITYRGTFLTTYNAGDPTLARPVAVNDPGNAVSMLAGAGNGTYPAVAFRYSDSTTYTLQAADAGAPISFNTATATTVTVPPNTSEPFPLGTQIRLQAYGLGTVTVAPGAGVTLRGSTLATSAQYRFLNITKRQANEWIVEAAAGAPSSASDVGALAVSNNLSDLQNKPTSRANLGVAGGVIPGTSKWLGGNVESVPALGVVTDYSLNSGQLWVSLFLAPCNSNPITSLGFSTGGATASGLTLARMALFTVDASDNLTMVARTANDTTFGATSYDGNNNRALATAGGYPASYTLLAGQRYALGVLQIGTATAAGIGMPCGAAFEVPPVMSRLVFGQSDIAASYAVGSTQRHYQVLHLWGRS